MSNERVDVLAVMDRRIAESELREFCDATIAARDATKETRDARVAVASLTEWAGVAEKFLSSLRTGDELEVEAWTIAESLRAALSRIGAYP